VDVGGFVPDGLSGFFGLHVCSPLALMASITSA
jgi:hypothetical protein